MPHAIAGSIRDDGPLPLVYGNVYEAQDAMRAQIRKVTTVICMATMLHTIATGNMCILSSRNCHEGGVRTKYKKYKLSFALFHSSRKRPPPYYRINARSFSVFYVVIDDTMEVRRVLFPKHDLEN